MVEIIVKIRMKIDEM